MVISSSGKRTARGIGFTKLCVPNCASKKGSISIEAAGSLDSQSVKTTAVPSSRGFDASKKIMERNRHILVDTP